MPLFNKERFAAHLLAIMIGNFWCGLQTLESSTSQAVHAGPPGAMFFWCAHQKCIYTLGVMLSRVMMRILNIFLLPLHCTLTNDVREPGRMLSPSNCTFALIACAGPIIVMILSDMLITPVRLLLQGIYSPDFETTHLDSAKNAPKTHAHARLGC